MRGVRCSLALLVAAAWLLPGAAWAFGPTAAADPSGTGAGLAEKDAERLFLSYINRPESLIRSCMFLGGVRVEEIVVTQDLATARIRYRIECSQEEITLPPLTRTLRENFLYRRVGKHWEILGRSAEISPAQRRGREGTASPPPAVGPRDPLDEVKAELARAVVAWAVLGKSGEGETGPFPGAEGVTWKPPILVSSENLGEGAELEVPGVEVIVLDPQALVQRTVLARGGTWIRFDALEIHEGTARVTASLVAPVLPPPRPGDSRTRVRSRVEADFLRSGKSWILSRSRSLD